MVSPPSMIHGNPAFPDDCKSHPVIGKLIPFSDDVNIKIKNR